VASPNIPVTEQALVVFEFRKQLARLSSLVLRESSLGYA
jgi:hypothetical protein